MLDQNELTNHDPWADGGTYGIQAQDTPADDPPPYGLDAERGVFITSEGRELRLRKIRALIAERLVNGQTGRPKVPVVEVTIAGKHKRTEENPADPDYQERLKAWEAGKQERLMTYLFTEGIDGMPSEDEALQFQILFPESNAVEIRYVWLASLIPDDDVPDLMEAIISRSLVTAKGLETSAQNFP